jgi:aspartate aminotransferase
MGKQKNGVFMTIALAARLASVKPSATLALNAKANQLKAQGKDIINLVVGEPDFDTPQFIKDAAIAALEAGFTKYTAVNGILELRQAISEKLKRDNQLDYDPAQIIVSTGLKQSLFNLMLAVLNKGDEVIIPAPYWVSYPEMVLIAGATPVIVTAKLENNLRIDAKDLAAAITPKTRMMILNSPSNPSGVVYGKKDLQAIAEVLKAHPHIIIASDDMYEKTYWSHEPFVNILNVAPGLKDRTIVLNGFSKTYSMTGWRLGYAAGPMEVIKAMEMIQSQSTSSANSFTQKAGVVALQGSQDCVQEMAKAFHARYTFLKEALSKIPGMTIPEAEGAFYLYPYVQPLIDRLNLKDDMEFCDYLLSELGLAVLPGSTCGTPGFIRLSFATSREALQQTVTRLKQAFA